MFTCYNCGAGLPDGANCCPYCNAVQQYANNTYQTIPNTPHDTVFTSGVNSAGNVNLQSPEAQQYYFNRQLRESIDDASTARGLGIICIVCAIINVFALVSWICGAMGIAKANSAMSFAQQTGNAQLYYDAKSAKSLNTTGLIISAVLAVIGITAMLLFIISTGVNAT